MAGHLLGKMEETFSFWVLAEDGRTPERVSFERFLEWNVERGAVSVPVAQVETAGCYVSTVFIAQMNPAREVLPRWHFETLVTDPDGNARVTGRYLTWDEAEIGHAAAVESVSAGSDPAP